MPKSNEIFNVISPGKGEIVRKLIGNPILKTESIINSEKIEGRNYAVVRTNDGYPGITFLQRGEFERLNSEGVPRISLKKAIKMQDVYLQKRKIKT